jgi:hypothetical protein
MRGKRSINQHFYVVPQLPRISSTPFVSLLASEVCYKRRSGANVWVACVDRAIGMAEVDFDEDTFGAHLGGEVVVRLVYQLARRACRTREENDSAAIFRKVEKAIYIF